MVGGIILAVVAYKGDEGPLWTLSWSYGLSVTATLLTVISVIAMFIEFAANNSRRAKRKALRSKLTTLPLESPPNRTLSSIEIPTKGRVSCASSPTSPGPLPSSRTRVSFSGSTYSNYDDDSVAESLEFSPLGFHELQDIKHPAKRGSFVLHTIDEDTDCTSFILETSDNLIHSRRTSSVSGVSYGLDHLVNPHPSPCHDDKASQQNTVVVDVHVAIQNGGAEALQDANGSGSLKPVAQHYNSFQKDQMMGLKRKRLKSSLTDNGSLDISNTSMSTASEIHSEHDASRETIVTELTQNSTIPEGHSANAKFEHPCDLHEQNSTYMYNTQSNFPECESHAETIPVKTQSKPETLRNTHSLQSKRARQQAISNIGSVSEKSENVSSSASKDTEVNGPSNGTEVSRSPPRIPPRPRRKKRSSGHRRRRSGNLDNNNKEGVTDTKERPVTTSQHRSQRSKHSGYVPSWAQS